MESVLLIEFQGFRDDKHQFLVKELVLSDSNSKNIQRYYLKPPYPKTNLGIKTQIANAWLSRYHHGLPWEGGKMSFSSLKTILTSNSTGFKKYLVTKGLGKTDVFGNLYNMDDFACVSYKPLKDSKIVCDHNLCCAVKNVKKLRDLLKKLKQESSVEH